MTLNVFKDAQQIEAITLKGKALFLFGQHPKKTDVILRHPSISRVHAALVVDRNMQVLLIDLGSRAGTFVSEPVSKEPGDAQQ